MQVESLEKGMATQSSILGFMENLMDRGAWWVTVHGAAKNLTQLKIFSMYASILLSCLFFFFLIMNFAYEII